MPDYDHARERYFNATKVWSGERSKSRMGKKLAALVVLATVVAGVTFVIIHKAPVGRVGPLTATNCFPGALLSTPGREVHQPACDALPAPRAQTPAEASPEAQGMAQSMPARPSF